MRRTSHICVTSSLALPLCLLLSACGGEGTTTVASIPPPPVTPTPTPTPTPAATPLTTISGYSQKGTLDVQMSWLNSPATRNGTYDLLGRLTRASVGSNAASYSAVGPGQFSLSLENPGALFNYALTFPPEVLPSGKRSIATSIGSSWEINPTVAYRYDMPYASFVQGLGQRLTAFDKASDGSEKQLFSYDFTKGSTATLSSLDAGHNLRTDLTYDIGHSYVAMGEWSWGVVDLQGKPAGDSGSLLFVNGDRTPSSGIPVAGSATYDARTLNGWVNVPFALIADFGQRTMSASIQQDYRYNPAGDILDNPLAYGIHVGGSAPFTTDGLFNIPLSGTVNGTIYPGNTPVTPAAEAVTGSMNGAFFGPHAEQVGGTFSLDRANGTQLFQDAFVGQQHQP